MIVNVAAYKFVDLTSLSDLKMALKIRCEELGLKGTILISQEGINLFVAGVSEAIQSFKETLCAYPSFRDIVFKDSLSDYQPFKRMLVKIKKEIIPFGVPEVSPARTPAPRLSPQELKSWFEQGKEMVVLDTRNSFEAKIGTFKQAMHLDIHSFRDFPKAAATLDETFKDKTVVTFCTGGIRCEKAAPLLQQMGFKKVYQLDGGILKYFEDCGNAFFEGECFVFDQRIALDSDLTEIKSI